MPDKIVFARDSTLTSFEVSKISLDSRLRWRRCGERNKQKDGPIVRNTIQWRPRDVIRFRVVINYRNVCQGIIIEEREGRHIEKLYLRLAENTSRIACAFLPEPEKDLDEMV
jgi:hypothetical protein